MEDSFEDTSPLEQELEALSAIYVDELTLHHNDDGQVNEVNLLLHPATGDDTTKKFVCMNLIFHPTKKYPDEAPAISIRNPRGLGQEEVSSLVEDMKVKAEESVGEVMLYTLIEMAKDSLTEGNIPHSPCIVCLEHFDESSNFWRTACYHYFHKYCLHKYLEHVRVQQAEEEAENARRDVHQKDGKSMEKEIICPLCRSPLDKESLVVHCVDSDEEDQEVFVPSPALIVQQQEMAARFEHQKAQGGIIDLEWEKNKYLINSDDQTLLRVPLDVPSTNQNIDESKDPNPKVSGDKSGDSSKHQSPHAITFHGKRSDERRPNQSYRRGEHRSQGRVSRGFRDRHRNFHSSRENEKHNRPTDRYEKTRHSYSKEFVADSKANTDISRGNEEESEAVAVDANGQPCSREMGRYNTEDRRETGWRGRGRGRGRFRDDAASEHGDDYDMRRGNRTPSANSESSRPIESDHSDNYVPSEQNSASKVSKSSRYDQRDYYRQEHRDQRPRGRGRGRDYGGRSSHQDTDHSGSTFRGNNKQSVESEQDSDRHDNRFRKGGFQRGKQHSQGGQHHSYSSQEERYGSHGGRNNSRREREGTGSGNSYTRRNYTGRRNADRLHGSNDAGDDLEVDKEEDPDSDMRNFEINQRWRNINYSASQKSHGEFNSAPRIFGVIDDNETGGDYRVVRGEDVSSDDEEAAPRPNPNYACVNGQLDHYYPGFDQRLEEESWEDEIDPYAAQARLYRGEGLRKYWHHTKPRDDHFSERLKERAQKENSVDGEFRRIRKEQEERRRNDDRREAREPQPRQSGRAGMTILEQFKQKQGDSKPAAKDQLGYQQENLLKEEMGAASATGGDVRPSAERSYSEKRQQSSNEETYAEICDEPFSQGEHLEEKETSHRVASVKVKDIKWCGRKNQNFYPAALLPVGDQCPLVSGMNGNVFEDAWERKSALDNKYRQDRRRKNKKDQSDPKENSSMYKEASHHRNYDKREPRSKVSNDVQKRTSEKEMPEKFRGNKMRNCEENLTNGTSVETSHQISPSQDESFRKPKPLHLRKSNSCQSSHSSKKSAEYVNKDESEKQDGQTVNSSKSSSFKKPTPLDFRKENRSKDNLSHKSLHEVTKDAPS